MLYCLVCISFLSFSVFLASRDIPLTFFKRGGGQHAVPAFCFTPSSCLGFAFFCHHTHQKRFEENMGNLMLAYLCFAFTKPGGHS